MSDVSASGHYWAYPQTLEPAMTVRPVETEALLTPAEVAALFRVDPKTVTRWAKAGKLTSIRTLGGHRRYREAEVHALLAGLPVPGAAAVVPGQREPAAERGTADLS
jgi:excisionase family DNA binding protein